MRPKVTFRDGKGRPQPIRRKPHPSWGWRDGDHMCQDDNDLPEALAEIVVHWRGIFAIEKPTTQAIKVTLRELKALEDADIVRAYRALDPWTTAHLWRLPDKPSPAEIRNVAAEAMRKLKHTPARPGRPKSAGNEVLLGVELVVYWRATSGEEITLTRATDTAKESPFLKWAADLFHRAGRRIKPGSIAPILRQSIKTLESLKTRAE